MNRWSIDQEDRRAHKRSRYALQATCRIGLRHYRAHIFDIGKKNMTLLALPLLPRARHYTVTCLLEDETRAEFHVLEVQRILLTRKKQRFLRVGLRVLDSDTPGLGLLVNTEKAPHLTETEDHREMEPVMGGRERERMQFQLPAFVRVDGKTFRCQTIDMNMQGIGIVAPIKFPFVHIFDLSFLDPAGKEVPLLVQEKNRMLEKEGNGEVRLGVQVIGGMGEYRRFLRRHS